MEAIHDVMGGGGASAPIARAVAYKQSDNNAGPDAGEQMAMGGARNVKLGREMCEQLAPSKTVSAVDGWMVATLAPRFPSTLAHHTLPVSVSASTSGQTLFARCVLRTCSTQIWGHRHIFSSVRTHRCADSCANRQCCTLLKLRKYVEVGGGGGGGARESHSISWAFWSRRHAFASGRACSLAIAVRMWVGQRKQQHVQMYCERLRASLSSARKGLNK